MSGTSILLGMVGAGVAAAVVWDQFFSEKPAIVAADIDPSASVVLECVKFRNGVERFITSRPGVRGGSTFAMFVMGPSAANPNAALVFDGAIPFRPDKVFGADEQAYQQRKSEFYGAIQQGCEAAKAGSGSPIYEMVRQGLAHLHGNACSPRRRCHYLIKTDLDDDVHAVLAATLRKASRAPDTPVPSELARSLDNSYVAVTFCGTAEVTARSRAAAPIHVRERIWRELFSDSSVRFTPHCNGQ